MKLGSNGMVGGETGQIEYLGVRAVRVRARCCRWNNSSIGDTAHYHERQWGQNRTGDVGRAGRRWDARLATKSHGGIEEEGEPILLCRKAGGGTIGLVDLIAPL